MVYATDDSEDEEEENDEARRRRTPKRYLRGPPKGPRAQPKQV